MSRLRPLLVVLALAIVSAAQAPPPLAISTDSVPKTTPRQDYLFELAATGGTAPLTWTISKGVLPPGITLDRATGRLAGTALAIGEFPFTVAVTDGSKPPRTATRDLVLRVVVALTVEWKQYPRAENNNSIRGSVVVTNGADDPMDLTFIAVAVNDVGKAYALGYQHFTLAADSLSPELDLGFTLPAGTYIVHVDAVAEVPAKNVIHRARLQTQNSYTVTGVP